MAFKFNPITNRLDLVETGGGGGGDVSGPGSSTNNAIVRWDGTTGTLIKNSTVTLSDTGDIVANSISLSVPLSEVDGGTNQSTYSTGDTLYASAPNTLSKLAIGSANQVLTVIAGVPSWQTPAASGVTSVSGTANRITSTGGSTPVIDISASYVGQSSITTLGTIATGVWQGTAVDATHGGTAQTSWASGDMLYASASNTLSKLTTVNNSALTTNASGVPTWPTPPAIIPGILGWFNGAPAIQTTQRYAHIYDDFLGGLSMTGVTANGGSTSYVTFPSALGGNNAGYYQIRSGTSTDGFASALLGGINEFAIALPTGLMYWETVLRGDQIGSVGDELNLYFGVHDGNSTNLQNGIYFSYVYATDTTHWIINTTNGGTSTSTVTSVVADPSNFTKLAFLYNSTGPTCTFYINGSSAGTITTNFPTASIGTNWIIQKVSGTTNVGWFIDLVNWVIQFTNSR